MLRVAAKNAPILLRRSFPLNETGNKTGTGTLTYTATTTTTPQGTLNPAVQNRVPALLRPIMPRGPQLLFNPGGRVASGPQSGTGAESVTATISSSVSRTFNDVGVNDDLAASHTIDSTGNLSTTPGVNRNGTGTLAASHTLANTTKIGRVGTGPISASHTVFSIGTIVPAQSASGLGALVPSPTITSSAAVKRNGSGALTASASVISGAKNNKAIASTLSVIATITCSATTTAKWNNKPRNSGNWTTIARA